MAYGNWFDFFFAPGGASSPHSLQEHTQFGSNPGDLRMFSYVPKQLGKLPLVVVLHGGMQSAEEYAIGSGWLSLANELGFAIVCPEQRRSNHPFGCFHWYRTRDVERGHRTLLCDSLVAWIRRPTISRR
jgi:poly(3-hydroxybutyrate) depolymerase